MKVSTSKFIVAGLGAITLAFVLGIALGILFDTLGVNRLITMLCQFLIGFNVPRITLRWLLKEELAAEESEQSEES